MKEIRIKINECLGWTLTGISLIILIGWIVFLCAVHEREQMTLAIEAGMERQTIQGNDYVVWAYPEENK